MRIGEWSETEHIDHYLTLIAQARGVSRSIAVPAAALPRATRTNLEDCGRLAMAHRRR